jgi:hypothetical protein
MTTITLSRNIFVPVKECGSVIVQTDTESKIVSGGKKGVLPTVDYNLCFYTCLMHHLLCGGRMVPDFWRKLSINKETKPSPASVLLAFKNYLTSNLPFANIFSGKEDPSLIGSPCDHRVIQKAANVFRVTIFILEGGNKIYKFIPEYTESASSMCLFFHKFHYRLVEDETYKEKVMILYDTPEKVEELYKPYKKYTNRAYTTVVKRGSKE